MVGSTLGSYSFGLIFVSARTKKRHHHLARMGEKFRRPAAQICAWGKGGGRLRGGVGAFDWLAGGGGGGGGLKRARA
jgi:hypothetical protein